MKTFIVENDEKERIKFLYESKGIILNEDSIWGGLAKVARKLVGQSEDDIAKVLKTTEVAITKSMDDIILSAVKSKNIAAANDIQLKLMHFFNPSGSEAGKAAAQEQVKTFLNGYAKTKGKTNWQIIRDEISGVPKPQAAATSSPVGAKAFNMFSKKRISNRSFGPDQEWLKYIDWSKVTNAKNIDDYNKLIAQAIKTGDYRYISAGGFEKFGIDSFRDFLKNNISKVNEVIPETGRWSVTFK